MELLSSDTSGSSWLRAAAEAGEIHSVRVSFSDRLGAWRGKRMPVAEFLERAPLIVAFCNGMIVCDVQCDVIEETPFSNYSTGYPDMYVHYKADAVRPTAWAPGEAFVFGQPTDQDGTPLSVAPMNLLAVVMARLGGQGARTSARGTLSGAFVSRPIAGAQLPHRPPSSGLVACLLDGLLGSGVPVTELSEGSDPGSFVVGIGPAPAVDLAESLVVTKGAAKELAPQWGKDAVFMTRRPCARGPSLLRLEVSVEGLPPPSADTLGALLDDARPLLFPSVNAIRAQAPAAAVCQDSQEVFVVSAAASSEADPATALAVTLAAVGAAAETQDLPQSGHPSGLAEASSMRSVRWLGDWLGRSFIDNAVPLLEREESLFRAAVTDWEISRYWSVS